MYTVNKKVIILSECVGNGHTKAAEALMQGITYLAPTIHTQLLEAGLKLHPITTKIIVRLNQKMNSLSPSLWGKVYHYKHNETLSNWKKFIIYLLFHRKIENLIEHEKPHLVICTHPFTSSSISRLKKLGYTFTLCTVLTDFHVHGAWVNSGVDIYLVSNEDMYNQLINMGVKKNRIAVTDMPIRSNFWVRKNKQEMRQKLGLKNIPTIMIMGGGLGLGGIQEIAHALVKWKENIQIIICTGNNEPLKRVLFNNKKFHHPHVHILGFVDIIDEWMEAADLLITKAGGLTCFEAMSKGLPIYIYRPIPGHEEKNCEFLINNHLALKIDDITNLDSVIGKLLFSPQEITSLYDRLKEYQRKINPLASAELIIKQLL